MAARPQWYFWSIGLTNRVQPYCRLAIITMQMMPKSSCPHRVASDAVARECTALTVVGISVTHKRLPDEWISPAQGGVAGALKAKSRGKAKRLANRQRS